MCCSIKSEYINTNNSHRERFKLAQTNDELIEALVPNAYNAAQIKKQWHDRMAKEINERVLKETETAILLAGLRQQHSGIDVNDLLAKTDNDTAIDRLAGLMTQDQIEQMQSLLTAVSSKITAQPEKASAQKGKELDDGMDAILAGSSPKTQTPAPAAATEGGSDEDVDEPSAKRHKNSGNASAE